MRVVLRGIGALLLLYLWPLVGPTKLLDLNTVVPAEAQEVAKVWVNTRSNIYHCSGSRYYGNTKVGEFTSEADAIVKGNRPAYGQNCGRVAAPTSASQSVNLIAPPAKEIGRQVWVNTASGVYHCPGTQYYGKTKRGSYMAESDARDAGHRPAYARTCGG